MAGLQIPQTDTCPHLSHRCTGFSLPFLIKGSSWGKCPIKRDIHLTNWLCNRVVLKKHRGIRPFGVRPEYTISHHNIKHFLSDLRRYYVLTNTCQLPLPLQSYGCRSSLIWSQTLPYCHHQLQQIKWENCKTTSSDNKIRSWSRCAN